MDYLRGMKTIRRICMALMAVCLAGCSGPLKDYSDFLYDSMPLPDRLVWPAGWWSANVQKTLEVRDRMGWDVPEREFRHFVLPLRVNNESLDDFRLVYADSLCERVEGMSMYDAALEVNHWCHERATYRPSDARTSSPMATIRAGFGRCGEESVLTVAAMRAVGIPARQVYTPRWAHTDDNRAWVEVYVDGGWHFLGACEPEPILDMGWFNAPVSRALLLHTKVFGDYRGEEDVISRTSAYTEINVISGYVPSRLTTVRVVDAEGLPAEGAGVEFQIYNYAEYYTVATYLTDKDGKASLNTGKGDLMVRAYKDGAFGVARASSEEVTVTLDRHEGETFSLDFDIVPPAEDPLPAPATAGQMAANAARLAVEDAFRASLPKGNDAVLDAFKNAHGELAVDILNSLSFKDMNDVTSDVLEDAWEHCSDGVFSYYRDCPRIELEMLYPYFSEIGEGLDITSPEEAWDWVCANVTVDDGSNPQGLRIPPVFVWRNRIADSRSRDIFYVALCRSLGFPARIDEVTGKAQYQGEGAEEGLWIDVVTSSPAPEGALALDYTPGDVADPDYYTHFTLSKIDNGKASLLSFNEEGPLSLSNLFGVEHSLEAGYYMLTTGRRLADGSVLSRVSFFNITAGESTRVPMVLRSQEGSLAVLGTFDAEKTFKPAGSEAPVSILSATGRGYFAVVVLGTGDEPSNHAVRQLVSAAPALNGWGRPIIVLSEQSTPVQGLENAVYGADIDAGVAGMLAGGAGCGSYRLPVVVVGDSFGRIVYFSQGYNTSLAEDLRTVTGRL